ncbi:MAG: CinA family protein [Candidatus Gastranaerophilales bacterium]|nr:CinA family protein [Candidatus Gastranaerophilales bacterium]
MIKFFINLAKITELLFGKVFPENSIGKILRERGKTVATTESCTGGLVSSLLTDVSGSSEYIFANFVTYSNEAKSKYLGVKEETLAEFGAVSEQTAKEMAEGLLKVSGCDYALATTGIAGPTGDTADKPIGLMYVGIADKNETKVIKINQPPALYRRIMKIAFAKEALKQLYLFIR